MQVSTAEDADLTIVSDAREPDLHVEPGAGAGCNRPHGERYPRSKWGVKIRLPTRALRATRLFPTIKGHLAVAVSELAGGVSAGGTGAVHGVTSGAGSWNAEAVVEIHGA